MKKLFYVGLFLWSVLGAYSCKKAKNIQPTPPSTSTTSSSTTSGTTASTTYTTGGCTNTCSYASDGVCDDGGPGATYSVCPYGTDCVDCGVRGSTTSGSTTSSSTTSSTTSGSTTSTSTYDPWNHVNFWCGGPNTGGQYFTVTLNGLTSDPIPYYYQTSYSLPSNHCQWNAPTDLDGSGSVALYKVTAGTYSYSATNYLGATKTGTVTVKPHIDYNGVLHACHIIKLW